MLLRQQAAIEAERLVVDRGAAVQGVFGGGAIAQSADPETRQVQQALREEVDLGPFVQNVGAVLARVLRQFGTALQLVRSKPVQKRFFSQAR